MSGEGDWWAARYREKTYPRRCGLDRLVDFELSVGKCGDLQVCYCSQALCNPAPPQSNLLTSTSD